MFYLLKGDYQHQFPGSILWFQTQSQTTEKVRNGADLQIWRPPPLSQARRPAKFLQMEGTPVQSSPERIMARLTKAALTPDSLVERPDEYDLLASEVPMAADLVVSHNKGTPI